MTVTTKGAFVRTGLLLIASAAPVATAHAQGVGYCFGDPGSGTPCPCNNDNDGSVPGSGCYNGVFASGAHLSGSGEASVGADTLVLACTGLEPNNSGLYFQANNNLSPGIVLGDGLRCAGGHLRRLGVRFCDGTGASDTSAWTTPISVKAGNVLAGDTKHYQVWYRSQQNSPCGSEFNTSNGYSVTWTAGGGLYEEMVLVPAGEFEMGRHVGSGNPNELPVHTVYLDAFYIDVYEVTNQKFAEYLNRALAQNRVLVASDHVWQVGGTGARICELESYSYGYSRITWDGSSFGVIPGKEDHPMVEVSWYGAGTYANQRSRNEGLTPCYDETTWTCDFDADGYRMPTEAEWEYAARGGEHSPYYMYPWADTIDGSMANFANSGDPYGTTTPVGYYDGNQVPAGVDMANGYGLYDTVGNVWEWCWDRFEFSYYQNSPYDNPTGPSSGMDRVLRGGGWQNQPLDLRSARRSYFHPTVRGYKIGFRVAAGGP